VKRAVLALAAAAIASAALVTAGLAQKGAAAGRTPLQGTRSLGVPRAHRNLTLIPIYDSAAKNATPYITLDEGLKGRRVKVKEAPGGGQVNTVLVTNESAQPLYLMGGEIILGGQQDRVVARDTIVPAGKKDAAVPAFCVEHGRWSGRAEFAQSAATVASRDIRADAQEGAFAAAQPAAAAEALNGRPARQAARADRVSQAQSRVWQKVAAKNRAFKEAPATGSYKSVVNLEGREAKRTVGPYESALEGAFKYEKQVVGVVAAIDGKPVAADIFGDSALFEKLWPKLLRSYAADAAESTAGKNGKAPAVTPARAKDFLRSAARAPGAEDRTDTGVILRLDGKESTAYRLLPKDRKPPAGGAAPAAIHESVIRK
jgi:hypothetical protein